MSKAQARDLKLLDEFVACFGRWDDRVVGYDVEEVTPELATGPEDEYGFRRWQPQRVDTPSTALEALYAVLPARLPHLYELLLLRYRWATVDLGRYRLVANAPGPDLDRLLPVLSRDPALWETLLPAGYVRFGMGPDMDYDPVCFDIRRERRHRDYRIVKFDHEEILCHGRLKEVAELAPTFRELVRQTIEHADKPDKG